MMSGVCLSVCLSVAFLDLTRERKSLVSPKLAGWKPIRLVTREPFRGKKVKGHGHSVAKCKSIAEYSLCTRIYADRGYRNSNTQQPGCSSVAVPLYSLLQIVRRSGALKFD